MEIKNKESFEKVISHFLKNPLVLSCERFGNGLINGTYKVFCETGGERNYYILQNINKNVFKNPESVMENIAKVVSFIERKVSNKREVLHFLSCDNDTLCHKSEDGEYWRMYQFVDNCDGVDHPTLEEFYESGMAFGRFQSLLSDFPAETLNETLPDFHNTPKRYDAFLNAVKTDITGRRESCFDEIEFYKAREGFYHTLIKAHKEGRLPLRVNHNDTKTNNVLLDNKTHKAVCVIDLDTVMSGFSVTDFGDSIRFGANNLSEAKEDLSALKIDIDKFASYTKGYIKGCGGSLTKEEIELLPEGALMMTLECGMRFLTDYLNGDTYFKASYPEHNLHRCRKQLKLATEMEKYWDKMKKIVLEFAEKE